MMMQRAFAGSALVLFVASAFVGMWTAYDSSLSWPVLLTLLASVSLFVAIANFVISPRWVSRVVVIVATLLALYFISQYAHFNYEYETGLLADLSRRASSVMPNLVFFTPHPNAVAGFVEGAFLLSLVLIGRESDRSRWIFAGTAVIIAYGLLVTGSRGAWTGVAIAMGIWILLIFRERALQLVVTGSGLVAGILGGAYIVTRLASPDQPIFIISSAFDTARSRFTLYQNSLQLLKDYPFTGVGLGDTFAMVYSRYQLLIHVPFLYYAHNLFLSIGLGQGLLGVVALVWLLFVFYRFVSRVERTGLDERSLALFRAAWLGTTASFIHGLTDSVQFSEAIWTMPMLFALAGLAVATGRLALKQAGQEKVSEMPRGQRHYGRWIALAGVTVALLVTVVVFRQSLVSAWYANIGSVYQTKADLSPDLDDSVREAMTARAVTYFERALSLDPAQSVANRRLGMIALEQHDFETATIYLEQAYTQESENQATLKALGYAYLWTGQLDLALERFQQLDVPGELVGELDYWQWWWGRQDRQDLSDYAGEIAQRLSGE